MAACRPKRPAAALAVRRATLAAAGLSDDEDSPDDQSQPPDIRHHVDSDDGTPEDEEVEVDRPAARAACRSRTPTRRPTPQINSPRFVQRRPFSMISALGCTS